MLWLLHGGPQINPPKFTSNAAAARLPAQQSKILSAYAACGRCGVVLGFIYYGQNKHG